MKMLEVLLPDPTQVRCDGVIVLNNAKEIVLQLVANTAHSACPLCGHQSGKVHSRYGRQLMDLPWADMSVSIQLQVRRFFCVNADCVRVIFCERLPGVAAAWARRTERLANAQRAIALALGGAAGARLCITLKMKAGIDLLLSLVRSIRQLREPTPRVLGIDDWASCKGQTYGTILVDLERGEIVDLLPDRTAETLIQWLKERSGIEIVTRDRSLTYAEAIQQAIPDAIQVADRWHLLKNLSDAVFKVLQQEYSVIKKQLMSISDGRVTLSAPMLIDDYQKLTPAELRRKDRIEQAHQLHAKGWPQKDVANYLHIHPKTVRRYLGASSPKARRYRNGKSVLDPFKSYLLDRWNEGCHNATQLFREIRQQGYGGEKTMVRDYVRQLRLASGLPPGVRSQNGKYLLADPTRRPPSLRTLTWLIVKKPEKLGVEEKETLIQMSVGQPKLATTIKLARAFAAIVREQQVEMLDEWLEQAEKSEFQVWRNFATSLRQDYDAIRAALLYDWSNGPTEGHVNRLKCVKRQMYGRAKLDLLRQRLVAT